MPDATVLPRAFAFADVLDAFRPNKVVSRHVMGIIIAGQIALAFLFWIFGPSAVVPRPMEVLASFGKLWMEFGLSREIAGSFWTNVEALTLTTAGALLISYATVLPAFRPVATFLSKCRFLGITGLTFLVTVELGGGHTLKLALLVFGIGVYFVTSMSSVIASIPRTSYDHARTLRMGEWRVVWEVGVLGTADQAFEVLRQNAAIGWMMLTMVEGKVKSEGGIGAVMLNQDKHFHLSEVFALQLSILVVGLIIDYAIGGAKNLACPYAKLDTERR